MQKCKLGIYLISKIIAVGILINLSSGVAFAAAPEILPGLWENKIEVSSKSGQIESAINQAMAMLEAMPPEQQKMMKDMMAKRGVNFDFANRIAKTCLTQEQINNFQLSQSNDDCSQTVEETSKGHFKMTLQCKQSGSGEGEYIIKNNKSFTGKTILDVDIDGQIDTMTMSQIGTWISEDCGDLAAP